MFSYRPVFASMLALSSVGIKVSAQTLYVPGGYSTGIGNNTANGNVGVGTSSPAALLHIAGNDSTKLLLDNGIIISQKNSAGVIRNLLTHFSNDSVYLDNPDGEIFLRAGATVGGIQLHTQGTERVRVTSSGNLGVGTSTPAAMFQVSGTVLLGTSASGIASGFNGEFGNPLVGGSGGFRFNRNSVTLGEKVFSSYHSNSGLEFYHEVLSSTDARFVFNGGKVGIGTTTPGLTLDVNGPVRSTSGSIDVIDVRLQAGAAGAAGVGSFSSHPLLLITAGTEKVRITTDGNVGIGTTSPSHMLSVNGTIRAKEVIVDSGWADYVFGDEYRLQSLAEVEAHIKEHRHLPGVPPAIDIVEKGLSIGEVQSLMMAKIEELTLHTIAQQKLIEAQQLEIRSLKVRFNSFTNETIAHDAD